MTSEAEWLNDMFLGAARDVAALPDWARPVLTPPVTATREVASETGPGGSTPAPDDRG
jgi:hypothetical protein